MSEVYIAGVGMTKFGKSALSLVELFAEAAAAALEESPVQEIDALYLGAMNPEEFTGASNIAAQVVEALGISGIPAMRVETASSAGAAALHAACHAVAAGYYRCVLVIGAEKMTHLTTSAATRILAEVIEPQERACGATMPALAAMITERYRQRYRLSNADLERALCAVAMKNHANGARNAFAQFQKPISKEIYLASKLVSTPLRLYDCSPITHGAAAVLVTAENTDLRIAWPGGTSGAKYFYLVGADADRRRARVSHGRHYAERHRLRRGPRRVHVVRDHQHGGLGFFSARQGMAAGRGRQDRAGRGAADQCLGRPQGARSSGRRQ